MQEKRKRELLFPYKNVRKVQKGFLEEVNSTIKEKSSLIAHAPTGIGKTAASLPLALKKAIEEDLMVFFLTPRHTQHQIAIDCLKRINEKYDKQVVATDMIGKRWMCAVEGIDDLSSTAFLDYCREAREEGRCEFYKNLFTGKRELEKEPKKVLDKLVRSSPLTTEEVIKIAKRKKLCPYYLSLELAKKSKVIIGDYYHIFNPPVRKALLGRVGKELEDSILIVDEAHLLPKRIRSLLTSKISNFILKRARKEAKDFNFKEVSKALKYCLDILKEIAEEKLKRDNEAYVDKEDFTRKLKRKVSEASVLASELVVAGKKVRKKRKQSYCGSVGKSIKEWLKERESRVRIIKKDGEYIGLVNKALDPSLITKKVFEDSYSSIVMSGSLVPTKMYEDILGIQGGREEYPSPFPDRNRLVLVYPEVTTKYTERGKDQYNRIASKCLEILNLTDANSALFFPSYDLLDKIKKRLRLKLNGKLFCESASLNKEQKLQIFKKFKRSKNGTLLAVSAGSFSGGMDFPGESLELVIVVGIPLAKPTLEVKSLISYYDNKFNGSGWGYAYIYPAIRRVLQASGRCIRSEDDRGAIVLMDERYLWNNYSRSLPSYWEPIPTEMPERVVKRFLTP